MRSATKRSDDDNAVVCRYLCCVCVRPWWTGNSLQTVRAAFICAHVIHGHEHFASARSRTRSFNAARMQVGRTGTTEALATSRSNTQKCILLTSSHAVCRCVACCSVSMLHCTRPHEHNKYAKRARARWQTRQH